MHRIASYIIAGVLLSAALFLHLIPSLFAGMLVYVLIHSCASMIPSGKAKLYSTAGLAVVFVGVLVYGMFALVSAMHGGGADLSALWEKLASIIEGADQILPGWVLESLPRTAVDIQAGATHWLREHSMEIRMAGKEAGVTFAHVLIGLIIGAMVAVQEVRESGGRKPFASALLTRVGIFHTAFRNVVLAQAKISLINAALTGVYLMIILPLMGIHLPFTKTIVLVTAIVGMLPVVGNLISNTIIILVGASVSLTAAVLSLVFLIVLHKGEYFLNARIVGNQISASAWELLLAMLIMESAFGLPGIAAAPVFYAYLKAELSAAQMV